MSNNPWPGLGSPTASEEPEDGSAKESYFVLLLRLL